MFHQSKKQQHYVWKRYLKAWAGGDDSVWALRGSNIFESNVRNLGQQRYFYELHPFTNQDMLFLKAWIELSNNEHLRKLNYWWVDYYEMIFKLLDGLRSKGGDDAHSLVSRALRNIEEEIQGSIESSGDRVLTKLQKGQADFFRNGSDEVNDFIIFICHQFLRTKKQRDGMRKHLSSLCESVGVNLEAIIAPIRHISATNIGWALYSDRRDYRLLILDAPEGMELITSDQPVVNLEAYDFEHDLKELDEVKELGFYYPVTPHRAALLTKRQGFSESLTVLDVDRLNRMMMKASHEMVFATNKEMLSMHDN